LEPIAGGYSTLNWQAAVGASGSVRAVDQVLRALSWSDGIITAAGLAKLRDAVLATGQLKNLKLPGLNADRAPVFPAGLAVLMAVFAALRVSRMVVAGGALRDG